MVLLNLSECQIIQRFVLILTLFLFHSFLRHEFIAHVEERTATTSLTHRTVDTVYMDPDDTMVQYGLVVYIPLKVRLNPRFVRHIVQTQMKLALVLLY